MNAGRLHDRLAAARRHDFVSGNAAMLKLLEGGIERCWVELPRAYMEPLDHALMAMEGTICGSTGEKGLTPWW
ncbi:hypothetical protein Val02_91480 [Virgisporangium aliadipatigenens]|uniref:Uncharacterized protein n=1 Tax=Virgisporangium aliadipatigenens TaxID=741659 RepID=A0A8J3YX16_9ACTN|nr:hypothetical protein Val02_91480 [Virgisporangium aliadipatigenens]